jgi:ABC-type uncharacterized transport system permease subunit
MAVGNPALGAGAPPLTRIWRRLSRLLLTFAPLWAVVAALIVGALALMLAGINPLSAYGAMLRGTLGGLPQVGLTLQKSTPLILAGLGIAFALQCSLFNIGAEGQIYVGAMTGTLVALYVRGLPMWLHIPLCIAASFVGGAIWGGIPGYLRAKRGLSEIIMTIMLNYVGFWFVSYLVHGPIREGGASYYPQTEIVQATAQWPIFWAVGRLHIGFPIALAAAAVVYVVLYHTTLGFQIRAVGFGARAAHHAGISPTRNITIAMLVSGGLAGMAGISEVLGVQHRLSDFFSPGYGYDAIAVALLAKGNPIGVVVTAIFFGALRAGSTMMQRTMGVPSSVAEFIQGVTVLFVAIAGALQMVLLWREKAKGCD